MTPKVVIENAVLRGSPHDAFLQRVATVYLSGKEYRVMAPSRATGAANDWPEQFTVRVAAESGMGENFVNDKATAAAIIKIVVDELKREEEEGDFWDYGKHPNARFYDAQLCLHGHVITAGGLDKIKEEEYCQICGSRCIHRCEKCNALIRGKRTMHGGEDYQVRAIA